MGVSVRASPIDAHGVFAEADITAGDLIHTMGGRHISLAACIFGIMTARINIDDPLQIGPNKYIQLDELSIKFNHSCEANAAIAGPHNLVALRDIAKGTEITFDYSATVLPTPLSWFWSMACKCGAPTCRGQIGDLRTLPKPILDRRRNNQMLPDYILSYLDRRDGRRARTLKVASRPPSLPDSGPAAGAEQHSLPPMPDLSFELKRGRIGILLIHGLGGTPAEVSETAQAFADEGFSVSCPHLSGHSGGYSDLKHGRWQDWAYSAEQALLSLRRSCDVVLAGGLSTGAILGLHLARKHPDLVDGVLAYGPTLWLNGWVLPPHAHLFRLVLQKSTANLFDFPDSFPHGIKDYQIREGIRQRLASGDHSVAGVPVTPGGAVIEHRWLAQSVMRQLHKIRQPVLIVHAREDDYANCSNAAHLIRRLGGPVETVTLDDSFHIVTVDRQRQILNERSIDFVRRLAAARANEQSTKPPLLVSAAAAN